MKIVVTGACGQLGYDFILEARKVGHTIIGLSHRELDITNKNTVIDIINSIHPDIIVNCAAYTKVNEAESNAEWAYKINALGPKYLSEAANIVNAKLVQISTNYVFDGNKDTPYEINDKVNPISVYGQTKAIGEVFVKDIANKYFIVRTAGLFGSKGNNFIKKIINNTNTFIKVNSNQLTNITYTIDLSQFILQLILTENYGIYHAVNSGQMSWADLAKYIVTYKKLNKIIIPISTIDTIRPMNSVLSLQSISDARLNLLPKYLNSLNIYLNKLNI